LSSYRHTRIHNKWPWWDAFHAFWHERLNYNSQGVQSSKPGALHASDAVVLFGAPFDDDDINVEREVNEEREDQINASNSQAGSESDDDFDIYVI
jgi:hypothetical protein